MQEERQIQRSRMTKRQMVQRMISKKFKKSFMNVVAN